MRSRGFGRGRALRLVAVGTAAAATVALSQATASGTFVGLTGNAADRASSAATFCTSAPSTLFSNGDSWTDETSGATDTNHQTDLDLRVRSSSAGDRHIWVQFVLPAIPDPSHCQLVDATLSLYNKAPVSGRNIDVYRGNPTSRTWTAADITWNNEPINPLGPQATNAQTTSTAGWQAWTVTDHVLAQYAGGVNGNNGFLLRDRTEAAATAREQVYFDRQDAIYSPRLVLTWG
jgi:hypothetical protein